ncbi:MAG: type II secretion system protein, partial [Oscillibacter sp.]
VNRKLRARRGETLTETLAAILIVSLASVVLMTLVVTAARINRRAGEGDKTFRQEQAVAEGQAPGTPGTGTGTVTVTIPGKVTGTYPVTFSALPPADFPAAPLTSYVYEKKGGSTP